MQCQTLCCNKTNSLKSLLSYNFMSMFLIYIYIVGKRNSQQYVCSSMSSYYAVSYSENLAHTVVFTYRNVVHWAVLGECLHPRWLIKSSIVRVCGCSLAWIAGLNSAGGMDVCLLWVLCVVTYRSLRWADSLSRVLPTVMHRLWSRNLKNEVALAFLGLLHQRERERQRRWFIPIMFQILR
jgi:hypothetical protein